MSASAKRSRRCPESFEVTPEMVAWSELHVRGLDLLTETAKFRDHEFNSPRSDWPATWRNWMRTAAQRMPVPRSTQMRTFRQADEEQAAERIAAFTGGAAAMRTGVVLVDAIDVNPAQGRLL